MKQFVFGLGNPGPTYQQTRHNIGYLAVQHLTMVLTGQPFSQLAREHTKTKSYFCRTGEVFLAQPLTYMNEAGQTVVSLIEYYDKELMTALRAGQPAGRAGRPRLVVIYDDLDIPVGSYKLMFGKGPKVHNGLNSIRQHLSSDLFCHLRLGVDGRAGQRQVPGRDYVLTPFSTEELATVTQVIATACDELRQRLG